jgi:hypothetical protein
VSESPSRIAKLDLQYPEVSEKNRAALEEAKQQLLAEGDD